MNKESKILISAIEAKTQSNARQKEIEIKKELEKPKIIKDCLSNISLNIQRCITSGHSLCIFQFSHENSIYSKEIVSALTIEGYQVEKQTPYYLISWK
jgi:hypothetical protein